MNLRRLFAAFVLVSAGASLGAAATLISLTGGDSGEGFSPLAFNAGSINVTGGALTIQGITFQSAPAPANPNAASFGSFTANSMTANSLGFGASPTTNDASMTSLLQGFTYVVSAAYDFSPTGKYIEFKFSGLTLGQTYQVDIFTVADNNPRNTNFMILGSTTAQDSVLTSLTGQIVQYSLTPDSSGNIAVRYGFGGSSTSGNSGLVSGIAITTSAIPEPGTYAALAGALVLGFTVLYRRRLG